MDNRRVEVGDLRPVWTSGSDDDGSASGVDDMRADRQTYIRTVLNLYTQLQFVTVPVRRSDRQLAGDFFDRQLPIAVIEAALLLGAARRMYRRRIHALPTIRSLHYFEPIIEELLAQPLPEAYIGYLRQKLQAATPLLPDQHTQT